MRRFGNGAVQPERSLVLTPKLPQTARDVAHRGAALIAPDGARHRKVFFQHGGGARPLTAEHIFPPEVVAVSVIVRLFAYRKLQKRQILPARFAEVGMVVELHTLGVDKLL